jgi:hypothetical protein
MITCQHAKHIFDQYLDGGLSPSLQTELHAHQLNCGDCQGELALLEACGDVIAYDRQEPTVSASFTDRVLSAQRAQFKPVSRRNWSRIIITIASPMAAAACIAFAVLLIGPTGKPSHPTLVAGVKERMSDQGIQFLDRTGKHIALGRELADTPQMPAGFVDALLGPLVEQSRNTFDSTKRSVEQLDSLIRLGFAGANSALAAGPRTLDGERKPMDSVRPSVSEPDPMDPFSPHPSSGTPDAVNGSEVDDTIEAL